MVFVELGTLSKPSPASGANATGYGKCRSASATVNAHERPGRDNP